MLKFQPIAMNAH